MKKIFLLSLLLCFLILVTPSIAHADGIIIPMPPICDPAPCSPRPLPMSQLEIRYHYVDVTIRDQVATTRIDQVFYNPNEWTVEGTYVFPIPEGATVTGFMLWIDGEPVQGNILDAEQARQSYEQIVREMKDPALLEYSDQDALQASIFPIPSKGERRIELEYSQVIPSENGLVRFIYPLNTEKFSTQPLEEVRIHIEVESSTPIRAAYSPSHPVDIIWEGRQALTVGYEDRQVKPDTDFSFLFSIGENEAFHLLSYRDPGEAFPANGYFALLLAPRPAAGEEPIPKDILLVLDRSGSMEGEKFQQAQQALGYILTHLKKNDRFNLISFSTDIATYAQAMQPASAGADALKWVNQLSAAGSTDINRALLEAVAMSDPERPTYLIFLTDGLPTEGVVDAVEILKNLATSATDNLRLFSFGVGYDVDTYLLDSLSQDHHGSSTYVLPGEQIDEVLSGFYARISAPVLTNLTLDFGEIEVFDLYPSPLPDLFDGTQIMLVGRYREGGTTTVTLRGEINQEIVSFRFVDQVFASEEGSNREESANSDFIPRLWATRKIGYLLNQVRLEGPDQELIDQIVHLSIRYGIVSPYTSYLVTEPQPLGVEGQSRIAEEQYIELEALQDAPTFGSEAVEKAAGQGELANSDLATRPEEDQRNRWRVIGSRTFVLSDETWMDTGFDPEQMETVKVAFLSADYFALADSRPSLAVAFALGPKVIAVVDGIAYEVVGEEETVDAMVIPGPFSPDELDQPPLEKAPGKEDPPFPEGVDPEQVLTKTSSLAFETEPTADEPTISPESSPFVPCLGAILSLVFFPFGLVWFKMKR